MYQTFFIFFFCRCFSVFVYFKSVLFCEVLSPNRCHGSCLRFCKSRFYVAVLFSRVSRVRSLISSSYSRLHLLTRILNSSEISFYPPGLRWSSRSKSAIVISCQLPSVLHAEKSENFCCRNSVQPPLLLSSGAHFRRKFRGHISGGNCYVFEASFSWRKNPRTRLYNVRLLLVLLIRIALCSMKPATLCVECNLSR